MLRANDRDRRVAAWCAMRELLKERSPQRIVEMERERGLLVPEGLRRRADFGRIPDSRADSRTFRELR
jgi:hypothetical protein